MLCCVANSPYIYYTGQMQDIVERTCDVNCSIYKAIKASYCYNRHQCDHVTMTMDPGLSCLRCFGILLLLGAYLLLLCIETAPTVIIK